MVKTLGGAVQENKSLIEKGSKEKETKGVLEDVTNKITIGGRNRVGHGRGSNKIERGSKTKGRIDEENQHKKKGAFDAMEINWE